MVSSPLNCDAPNVITRVPSGEHTRVAKVFVFCGEWLGAHLYSFFMRSHRPYPLVIFLFTTSSSIPSHDLFSSLRYDPFDSVTLTIPSSRNSLPGLTSGLSLDQLLLSFVSREPVRDVECRGCSRMLGRKPGEICLWETVGWLG